MPRQITKRRDITDFNIVDMPASDPSTAPRQQTTPMREPARSRANGIDIGLTIFFGVLSVGCAVTAGVAWPVLGPEVWPVFVVLGIEFLIGALFFGHRWFTEVHGPIRPRIERLPELLRTLSDR